LGLLNARYVRSEDVLVEGNVVELVPPVNLKTGLQVRLEHWRATLQYGYVGTQFTDAYNTELPPVTAISGKIPAYSVVDLSAAYRWSRWEVESGVTNLTNANYFTRRATGYPGPGVIPADPRMFFLTLRLRLNTSF
jgi:Fe(3+) dicitrate transport protein